MMRAVLNAILSFGSVWYVIFITGSAAYGIYAGALAVFNFIDLLLKADIRIHLLKFNPDILIAKNISLLSLPWV